MFIQFIFDFFETLINTQVAEIFSAPLALFMVLMLIFGLFTIFCSGYTKRIFLIFILVIVVVFMIFSMASNIGFITLPITFGGV